MIEWVVAERRPGTTWLPRMAHLLGISTVRSWWLGT